MSSSEPRSDVPSSQQLSQRPQVDVQVFLAEIERVSDLGQLRLEFVVGHTQALDLVVGQPAPFDAPKGLALEHLAKQLDQSQH